MKKKSLKLNVQTIKSLTELPKESLAQVVGGKEVTSLCCQTASVIEC